MTFARSDMAGSYVGIDMGSDNVKIAVRDRDTVRLISHRLPENLMGAEGVVSPEVTAQFLHNLRNEEGIRAKDCSVVLSDQQAFFRHMSLPAMTVEELKLNLPYEFHDYITDDPESYSYDYAVDRIIYDDKNPAKAVRMDLYAAAARKKLMDEDADILRRAGFRLKVVNPAPMAYTRLMETYAAMNPLGSKRSVVLVNIGYEKMNVILFDGAKYQGGCVVDAGCRDIDDAIASLKQVDRHVADSYKDNNYEDVLDSPECHAVYDRLVFEISKVINFYNFSNQGRDIESIYLLGGGAAIPQLITAMGEGFDYPVWLVNSLLPDKVHGLEQASVCALAYAGLLVGEAIG
jgi:type IV pilus assembly protein PilM